MTASVPGLPAVPAELAEAERRISLNRSDLLRLCDVVRAAPPVGVPWSFRSGWDACVEAIRAISVTMPDGCALVSADELDTARATLAAVRSAVAAAKHRADKSWDRTKILAMREVIGLVEDALDDHLALASRRPPGTTEEV